MSSETLRIALLALVGSGAGVWLLSSALIRVSGVWEREPTEHERAQGAQPERITLAQLGPFVTGRRDVVGGHQEFSGLLLWTTLRLNRRDHGERSLAALGFPEPIARKLAGEQMARLELRLVDDVELVGTFRPRKVEFTHQPPRITAMFFLPPQERRYRRVQPLDEVERVPDAST